MQPLREPQDPNFIAALQALHQAGIREPTARRLARLPHVTPEYVRLHVEQANTQGFTLGMAIHRIEHGWPTRPRSELPSVEDRIRRFLGTDRDGGNARGRSRLSKR